jgi:hypothetical protein
MILVLSLHVALSRDVFGRINEKRTAILDTLVALATIPETKFSFSLHCCLLKRISGRGMRPQFPLS